MVSWLARAISVASRNKPRLSMGVRQHPAHPWFLRHCEYRINTFIGNVQCIYCVYCESALQSLFLIHMICTHLQYVAGTDYIVCTIVHDRAITSSRKVVELSVICMRINENSADCAKLHGAMPHDAR